MMAEHTRERPLTDLDQWNGMPVLFREIEVSHVPIYLSECQLCIALVGDTFTHAEFIHGLRSTEWTSMP